MADTDTRFTGSIPELYEQYLVPLLFEPYAVDLAARLADLESGVVIEVAAGTGAVTRALRRSLPAAVRLVATDLNEAMLAVNERLTKDPSITFRQADALKLPFDDASADALVCQFGVMFFPDRTAGYREARRVVRPGGRYIFNVWDRLDRNEASDIASRVLASLFPEDPPRFFERTPYGYNDVAAVRRDLERAGFRRIEIETVERVTRCSSAKDAAIGLIQGTPLRSEVVARDPARLEAATVAAAEAISKRFGTSSFDNPLSAHVVTAIVPEG